MRSVQQALAVGLALMSALAVIRLQTASTAVFAVAMVAFGYFASRELPDFDVRLSDFWRVGGVAFLLLIVGAVIIALDRSSSLIWTAVVLSYSAGNRLRASALLSGHRRP